MTDTHTPRISIIMIDGSFRESFHSIRFFGEQTMPRDDYELIWVEYYDSVNPQLRAEIEKHPNFRIITLNRTGTYHSSYCFNAGITAAQAELIAIPDADVVVEPIFLEALLEEHESNEKLVLYFYRFNESEEDHREDWTLEHLMQVGRLTNPTNFGGCLSVRKKWLLAINGYEQHPIYEGEHHGNGREVNYRLKALGLHIMWHPDVFLYHPWHPSTATSNPTFFLQRATSEYRASHLVSHAVEGIDPANNRPMPDELTRHLAELLEQRTGSKSRRTPVRRLIQLGHKVASGLRR